MKKTSLVVNFLLITIVLSQGLFADPIQVLTTPEVIVHYAKESSMGAKAVEELFPVLHRDLQERLGGALRERPTIVLMNDSEAFRAYVGSDVIVAVALPQRQRIIIDYPRALRHPFSLASILKHELCHLMINTGRGGVAIPKWLDEGIAQWVSDGMAEIVMADAPSAFDEAVLARRTIPLRSLNHAFPSDRKHLMLAYEESRSVVEHIVEEYGEKCIQGLLGDLREGQSIDEALRRNVGLSLGSLEQAWLDSTRKQIGWHSYLINNMYDILFVVGALIMVAGFIRFWRKRKRYRDMD